MPSLLGVFYAASITDNVIPLRDLLAKSNNSVDWDFYQQVICCRNQLITWSAVSIVQGHVFTLLQTFVLAILFYQLPIQPAYYGVVKFPP
ncbi:hypothetical protein VTN77DRAFT_3153 [Rasamsonia byssochlamydoides]|uniref:uncharacterized protein n=1 Tax=Rasamsonia byssochlamydoides TaxID=89139 RepID=UPI003742D811